MKKSHLKRSASEKMSSISSASMNIAEMFRSQARRQSSAPYFSPEKVSRGHREGRYSDDALSRPVTKLSKMYRAHLAQCKQDEVKLGDQVVSVLANQKDLVRYDNTHDDGAKTATKNAVSQFKRKDEHRNEQSDKKEDYVSPVSNKKKKATEQNNPPISDQLRATATEEYSHSENNVNKTGEDDANESADADDRTADDYSVPYYLENFHVMIKTVLGDEFYIPIFNEDDTQTVEKFNSLSESAQKLYVRLFQRRFRWIRKSKISYPKIAEDLSNVLQELKNQQLLFSEESLDDLGEILSVLPAGELRQLAKSLKLNPSQQMSELIQAIMSHSRQNNISNFFTVPKCASGSSFIARRAKTLLGPCYKLAADCRDVFVRIVMLFSLHQIDGDMDKAAGGQTQLFQMLMTNIGQVIYPKYRVNKQTVIFKQREDLIRFQKAVIREDDIFEAMDKHQYDTAMELYLSAHPVWKEIHCNHNIVSHDESLPEQLRQFTAGSVYTRVMTYGVEVLQKKRMYKEAVELLEELLKHSLYQPTYRGRWYDRLALNLDQHLKLHSKALDIIKLALSDECVRFGHRFALFQRAQRICSSPSKKSLKHRWKDFEDDVFITVMEAPTVTIEGRLLTKNTEYAVYVTDEEPGDAGDKTLTKRVEDVALAHYRENGYPEGIHGEGSTFNFLLVLFMWEVLYESEVPDTFLNPYQTHPLDLNTDNFYRSRQEAIEARLTYIRQASTQELLEVVTASWTAHEGVLCVNWELFRSLEHVQGLVQCIGGGLLAAIIDRMIKNMRFTRSGVPDLVVWNPQTLAFRVVEVKGPNDRLSVKQILWLDYLVNIGVPAETCYVRAVGCKKLR